MTVTVKGQITIPQALRELGAHAEAEGHALLTRDPLRYRTYFPKGKLIAPR